MEAELVKRKGLPYTDVPAAGVHGVGLSNLPRNLWQVGRGLLASRRILKSFQPDVLFFTGGYVAVPMALSARMAQTGKQKFPRLLYVPDIEPGLALKTLAKFSDQIAVTVDDTKKYLPEKSRVSVCGYPVRPELTSWAHNETKKQEAYLTFGLSNHLPTLLVFGGSKGARSINRAVFSVLSELLNFCQVIHISGNLDWNEVEEARSQLVEKASSDVANRYKAFPYLHEEMGQALALADMVISRAGASILGEFPCFGVPAILVPYPYAWRYQYMNASYLVEKGAALLIKDNDLSQRLLSTVQQLLNDQQRLLAMRAAMSSLAKSDAAQSMASLLENMASGGAA
jgi:UDP-N-acetylglucosamine--N-acetylmuramyl-(pentapeptide) pyrophosphoryl-undecaprenol N-acetylglucosamine transferase